MSCSQFLLLETISEEEEGWAFILLIFLIGEAESWDWVERESIFAGENLHLVKLSDDHLEEGGGSFLEVWDSIIFALFLQLLIDSLQVGHGPGHDVMLLELNLRELSTFNNVNNSLNIWVIL